MKAPDKIYLHGYSFDEDPCKTWEKEPKIKNLRGYRPIYAEYLRTDALLEWARKEADKSFNSFAREELGMEGDKWIMTYIGSYESMLKTCKAGDKVHIIIVKED